MREHGMKGREAVGTGRSMKGVECVWGVSDIVECLEYRSGPGSRRDGVHNLEEATMAGDLLLPIEGTEQR